MNLTIVTKKKKNHSIPLSYQKNNYGMNIGLDFATGT